MQTLTIISLIVNFTLIMLLITVVRPKVIQYYKSRKKRIERQREIAEYSRIKRLVNEYLDELRND